MRSELHNIIAQSNVSLASNFIPVLWDGAPGQSNSIGRGEADRYKQLTPWSCNPKGVKIFYKPDYTATDNGYWSQLYIGSVQTVEPDLSTFRVFGGYVTAALKLAAILNRDVFIIPTGDGGTVMNTLGTYRTWNPATANECFDVAHDRYFTPAISKLQTAYPGRQIVVFRVVHEGETDAGQSRSQADFLADIQAYENSSRGHDPLILRAVTVVCEINYMQTAAETTINAAWAQFIATDPQRVKFVTTSDLKRKVDLTTTEKGGITASTGADDEHLSYLAQIEKGWRIAEAIRLRYSFPDVSLVSPSTNTGFDPSTINAGHVRLQMSSGKVTLTTDTYKVASLTNDLSAGIFNSVTNLVYFKHDRYKGWTEWDFFNLATTNLPRIQSSAAIGTTLFAHSFSYGEWIRPRDGNPPILACLVNDIQNTASPNNSRLLINIATTGKINIIFAIGGTAVQATTNTAVFVDNTIEEPIHLAVTFTSGGLIRIYVNAVLQTLDAVQNGDISGLTMANYVNATNTLTLGANRTGAGVYANHFYGHRRELTIQPVVWSVSDIQNLMLN
jgi:hypothetical protein